MSREKLFLYNSNESSYLSVSGFLHKSRIRVMFRVWIRVEVGFSVRVTGLMLSG